MLLTLSDGLNSARSPVRVQVRVRDVTLHLVASDNLEVFPMTRTAVASHNMMVAASDDLEEAEEDNWDRRREIVYEVTKGPQFGRLLYRDVRSNNVSTGTIVYSFNLSQLIIICLIY